MEFISIPFVCFLIGTFILYYAVKGTYQKIVLLLASMFFIGYYRISFLIVAILIALFTYGAGRLLAAKKETKQAQYILGGSIVLLIGGWLAFRYCSPVFPLGISFYTFQAISYLVEVYWEGEEPEPNVMDFVLYMLLFMKFLSGPIERGFDLLPQLKHPRSFDYERITYGLKLMMVGAIMKLVIADRVAPFLDAIFDTVKNASGIQLLEASLLYPIQLYADFAGYTNMAIGIGMLFGFKLSPNFNRPFISLTTSDLWRRWHMSLSFWVRDYIFVPLTASTRRWGKWGIYFSLLATFVALGIWHGAGWTFAIYGMIQGLIIIYETAAKKQREKMHEVIGNRWFVSLSIIRTYLLFAFSLLFFRIDTLAHVGYTLRHAFDGINASWSETNLGMADSKWIVFGIAVILMFVYESYNGRHDLIKSLEKQHTAVRWTVYYLVSWGLFLFGAFGVDNFIYIQF
jgi:D-alanyl-lipoteichoic acid acyltransferase DltB (MBOAT superfamily)